MHVVTKIDRCLGWKILCIDIATVLANRTTSLSCTLYFKSLRVKTNAVNKQALAFHIKSYLFYFILQYRKWDDQTRDESKVKTTHIVAIKYVPAEAFQTHSCISRRSQHDLMFIRNVFRGRISSASLLQAFSISVPCRTTRQQTSILLKVPFKGQCHEKMVSLLG